MKKINSLIFSLLISWSAMSADPGWTVNPGSFAYSMTATSVANVSCVELANSSNKIGAFVNGQCRGVVNTSTSANGRMLGFLVIYSNLSSGEKVKFQIYDAVLDSVFDSADSLVFANNATVGTVSNPYVVSTNHAPTNISVINTKVYENMPIGTFITKFATADTDVFDTHTYTLAVGLLNNNEFTVSGDSLLTAVTFNYELQNQKNISVTTDDGNGCTFTKQFSIQILDTNDIPTDIQLSNDTIAENKPIGTFIGSLSSSDEDTWDSHIYTLVTGSGSTHNAYFAINGNSLKTDSVLNFENISTYSIRVRTTDLAGTFFEKNFIINALDKNDPPTNITLDNDSITENMPVSTLIANLSVTDEDAVDTHVYMLTANASVDNSNFMISGTQLLSNTTFDFETKNSYNIELKVTDSGNDTLVKQFTVIIKDTNDVPTNIALSFNYIPENKPIGTLVGNFSTTDQDTWDTHTYSLVAGSGDADNSSFTISGNQLLSADTFHYAVKDTLYVRVRTTDIAGTFFEKPFIVIVTDENDTPTDITLDNDSIEENKPIGSLVGKMTTADVDTWDSHVYSLVSGTGDMHNTYFAIKGDSLVTDSVLDYESISTYFVRLKTTDLYGAFYEKEFTIFAIDVNDPPVDILLDNDSITENLSSGSIVGNLSVVDEDAVDSFSYSLTLDTLTDNNKFQISGTQLLSAVSFDYEIKNSYLVKIKVTDSGNDTLIKQFTIFIKDTNDVPTNIMISDSAISENMPAGTLVGSFSTTDQDTWDTHTYSLVSGTGDADNASFTISGNQLLSADTFDYELKDTLSVRIRTTDLAGTFFEKSFIVIVIDENDTPTDITLDNDSIEENKPIGSLVGKMTTADVDTWDSHVYSLVSGVGDTHNTYFAIQGDSLVTDSVLDYESISTYFVRLRTTDLYGAYFEKEFIIYAIDVNDPPVDILLSNDTITENLPDSSIVGLLSVVDEDAVDSHIFTLTNDSTTDNIFFTINGNVLLSDTTFDYETKEIYTISVKVTDSGNDTLIKQFTIIIKDTNDFPTNILISDSVVSENQIAGTLVGNFSTTDQDTWDVHSYSLVAGPGDTNNTSFSITGNQLITSSVFNFESKSQYSIRVRTTDLAGTFFEKTFTVYIKDENDVPTDITISNDTISENNFSNSLIALLSFTDEDVADTAIYTLVSGSGSSDNGSFSISGEQLIIKDSTNFELKNQYYIRLKVDDQKGGTFEKQFVIKINDVNENPYLVPVTFYVSEDMISGTVIGDIEYSDEDILQQHNFSILNQSQVPFSIHPSLGTIVLANAVLDYETTPSYILTIVIEDNGTPALSDTINIEIIVNDAVEETLPCVNYISPNGDGKNDFWIIENVDIYKLYTLVIFNEQGQPVYERNGGYDNTFDGTYNGSPLPTGLYYFVLKNAAANKEFKGFITIVN